MGCRGGEYWRIWRIIQALLHRDNNDEKLFMKYALGFKSGGEPTARQISLSGGLLMRRGLGMTASPERRDTSALVSVSIRHAAVWFNQRRPGSGRSGNIPLLICWWEDAIPLHEGQTAGARTRTCTRASAQSHTGIPWQHERKRDTTSACRQTGTRTKEIARKPHARASAHAHILKNKQPNQTCLSSQRTYFQARLKDTR